MTDHQKNTDPVTRVNHIKCDVTECKYHGKQDACHAEMITVSPSTSNCVSKQDTNCATFET